MIVKAIQQKHLACIWAENSEEVKDSHSEKPEKVMQRSASI